MTNNVYANQADALEMSRPENPDDPIAPPSGDGPIAADFPGSTPGPWRQYAPEIDGKVDPIYRFIQGGDGIGHAELGYRGFRLSGYIHESDARLMAAAPELLAAAIKLVELLKSVGDETGWRDKDETDRVFAWHEFGDLLDAIDKATPVLRPLNCFGEVAMNESWASVFIQWVEHRVVAIWSRDAFEFEISDDTSEPR